MTMRPEDERTLIIAQRTKKNLDFIYKKKEEGKDVEEFTQLLNSMLGTVINLREDYFKGRDISWDNVKALNLQSWDDKLIDIRGKSACGDSPNLQQVNSFCNLHQKH